MEEIGREHLAEQFDSGIQLLIKATVLGIYRDNESIDEPNLLQVHDHFSDVKCVTALRVTETWRVNYDHSFILIVSKGMSNETLHLRSLGFSISCGLKSYISAQ